MAHKRMFSKDITGSDAFREMPQSSQNLYFHLGMDADDDGFLDNYKGIIRSVNASEDDLKVLISKRFLILFPSKVIVIKHWKINNTIQKDRYHETKYLEEKNGLVIKDNGSYTERIQDVSKMEPQYRIGEDRKASVAVAPQEYTIKEEENTESRPKSVPKYKDARIAFSWFPSPEPSWYDNTTELKCGNLLFQRGEERVKKAIAYVEKHKEDENFQFVMVKPSDYERKWNNIAEYARRT